MSKNDSIEWKAVARRRAASRRKNVAWRQAPALQPESRLTPIPASGSPPASHAKDGGERGKRQDTGPGFGDFDVLCAKVDLIEARNVRTRGEVGDVPAQLALAGLAFHGEDRFPAADDDKIDLTARGVPEKTQLHVFPLGVFDPVAILEQVGGDEVFESRGRILTERPIPHIEFPFLGRRPELGQPVGLDPEANIEVFQDRDPPVHGLKGDGEILPEIVN